MTFSLSYFIFNSFNDQNTFNKIEKFRNVKLTTLEVY